MDGVKWPYRLSTKSNMLPSKPILRNNICSLGFSPKPTMPCSSCQKKRYHRWQDNTYFTRIDSVNLCSNVSIFPRTTPRLDITRTYSSNTSNVVYVNEANFSEVVERSQIPVIVDCKADWCGPCKVLGPKLEHLVAKANGKVKLAVLDIDESQSIADQLQVHSVPTVFAFSNGKVVDSFVGNASEEFIQKFVGNLADE